MASTIHFPEKVKQSFMEKFAQESETEDLFSHELDTEFSGVRTVHVYTVKTEPLQKYDRSKEVGTGSRYGTTKEVGDSVQTFEMTQDDALSLSIDKGNNKEQFNMKLAGKVMKAERQERIVPHVDKYRLNAWAKNAGIHFELSAALSKSNIVSAIMDAHTEMLDAGCPDDIRLVIARKYFKFLKLSDEWVGVDALAGKTLPKGTLGEFDGMPTKQMTSARMPDKVPFMLLYKGSIIAPKKIEDFKGHVDPPGLSGDLLEFRLIHDAFVLGAKSAGCLAACELNSVVKTPKLSNSSGTVTFSCDTSGVTYHYTTDGSDPRYSKDAKTGSSAVLTAGDEMRVYASKDDMFNSAVAALDYAGE